MAEGQFREDLYYRLSVLELTIPPLRRRREDIVTLVKHFLKLAGSQRNFSSEALEILKTYDWPGNVRQLRNLVTKLSIMAPEDINCFTAEDVRSMLNKWEIKKTQSAEQTGQQLMSRSINAEKERVMAALGETGYCITAAARMLGVSRNTLYNKIRKYKIDIQKSAK